MAPNKITTAGTVADAIGNNGVGNVDGAVVVDTAAVAGRSITRECGIGNGEAVAVKDAAADCSCTIAREGRIVNGEGARVGNATAAAGCCRIAGEGRIVNCEGARVGNATTVVSSIARESGIGDGNGASVIKGATITIKICTGNGHARDA